MYPVDINTGLYADSIQKSFDGREILVDICVHLQRGEIIGLLGRNGCGKSTLLQIIFGSMNASYKHVKVDGNRIDKMKDNKRLIAYLPQESLVPNAVAVETLVNISCTTSVQAMKMKENKFIAPFLRQTPETLSGGERRLLEISLLLDSEAPFILMDEPFNGISPINKEEVITMIRSHPEKGFIITDHEYNSVLDVATRIVLLHNCATKSISHKEDLVLFGYLPDSGYL